MQIALDTDVRVVGRSVDGGRIFGVDVRSPDGRDIVSLDRSLLSAVPQGGEVLRISRVNGVDVVAFPDRAPIEPRGLATSVTISDLQGPIGHESLRQQIER
jgi:hypothetical protein